MEFSLSLRTSVILSYTIPPSPPQSDVDWFILMRPTAAISSALTDTRFLTEVTSLLGVTAAMMPIP